MHCVRGSLAESRRTRRQLFYDEFLIGNRTCFVGRLRVSKAQKTTIRNRGMRAFFALWKRELMAYYFSPIAYVVVLFFLILMGFSVWFLIGMLSVGSISGSIMTVLYGESIFFWVAMLIAIPVITMRLLADEVNSGTIESLLTAPVTERSVVLAKYAGAMTFFVIMWLPTMAYAYIIRHYDPNMSVDLLPMLTGSIGTWLIGSAFISMGILASSLTKNQVIAAIICFVMVGLAFFGGFVPYLTAIPLVRSISSYFSPILHMMDFSRGILDSRPFFLYASATILLLFTSIRVVESGRWK